ncbi:uncharacterized protein BDV17DRAFT_216732 [Aspergillus undulatus]|uniref:uncharacterized protein n=1 Tax=Aspergillus undulatus TaxID=1810928 RepID=UPI003CCDB5E3
MEGKPQRRSSSSTQMATAPTPSSLRHCSYPSPAATLVNGNSGSKSLGHSSKSKTKSGPPPALTRVKGKITMETQTQMGSDMSWLKDTTPTTMANTPRTPQRSRTHTLAPNTSSYVNPSSALLQDLLKEQRATRGARTGGPEELEISPQCTPDRCQSQSQSRSQCQSISQEEQGSGKQRSNKMSSSGSIRRPPEMGVRETDQYISKISKQNFDLKLEIFYRAQQLSHLEKKLERMQELEDELERMRGLDEEVQELRAAEEDNQRLRESNEQLRQEIDKRDQAVTEAVELICQLEARVEELNTGSDISRPSTAQPPLDDESSLVTPKNISTLDLQDIPERTSSRRGTRMVERRCVSSRSRILQRAPSFLLEESKSTAALRSLYTEAEDPVPMNSASPAAMMKSESMDSMTEIIETGSPRLSALSECSELNISEAPITEDGFDQIDIPVRKKEKGAEGRNLPSAKLGFSNRDLARIDRWLPTTADNASKETVARVKTQHLSDIFKQPETSSPSSSFNSSSQKSKMDSIFGGSRMPPTPDTMTTAYPVWANSSSNSTIADKSQTDLRRYLTRTWSADEVTSRRSSLKSEPRESMETNASRMALPRPSLDERDDGPAFFPLNSVETRHGSYYGNQGLFCRDFDRVLARMDKDYYSPFRRTSRDETASLGSTPRSLTPQDWMEAARPRTRNRTGPLPANSRLVGARAPSQSSFLGRRHSIDSAVREPTLPIIQTLNLRSLESNDGSPTEPEPEPRRRISLLPTFFNRSANARRLQPSPMSDPAEQDSDGAPSPVIRKTRNQTSKSPRPLSGQGNDFSTFTSTGLSYAEDGMLRSFTEAIPTSPSTARPTTSNGGKDQHKRRGSLGIFGWMKGASANLGSSLKKSDAATANPVASSSSSKTDTPASPTTVVPASNGSAVRASSRPAVYDNGIVALGPEPVNTAGNKPVELGSPTEDFAIRTRHPSRADESAGEQGRRPRYMERRSRRT